MPSTAARPISSSGWLAPSRKLKFEWAWSSQYWSGIGNGQNRTSVRSCQAVGLTSECHRIILCGMVPGETRNPLTELRRGVLEYCVLAVVRDDESYAFDIVRELSGAGELVTSEGTI